MNLHDRTHVCGGHGHPRRGPDRTGVRVTGGSEPLAIPRNLESGTSRRETSCPFILPVGVRWQVLVVSPSKNRDPTCTVPTRTPGLRRVVRRVTGVLCSSGSRDVGAGETVPGRTGFGSARWHRSRCVCRPTRECGPTPHHSAGSLRPSADPETVSPYRYAVLTRNISVLIRNPLMPHCLGHLRWLR